MLEFESRTSKIKFTSYRVGGGAQSDFPEKVLIKTALIVVSYMLGNMIISNRYLVIPGRRPGTILVFSILVYWCST